MTEERPAGKRSREGSAGAAQDGQPGVEKGHCSRDDGSDLSGSRRQRRKEQDSEDRRNRGAGSGEKEPSVEEPDAPWLWPEYPDMGGESPHAGKRPKYVGIIAIMGEAPWPGLDELYVCLVTRKSGLNTFPKDIVKRSKPMIDTALDNWSMTTGISLDRIGLEKHLHVDDEKHGCRFLVARCH